DWALVVIEEVEAAHFERAIVRAITSAHTAVISHYVEAVLTVDGRVNRANGLARRVLAVLAHHWLMHDLGIFWPVAVVLVEWFRARVIAIDPDPMHAPPVRRL